MGNTIPSDTQSTARPTARWTAVQEAGRTRLVMSWSVPEAGPAAAPVAAPAAPVAVPVPTAA